jgi:peptidyl-tRNA hydrolase, PTH1 family
MKFLVVGLGNPGIEYEHTRHNIGFDVLDQLIENQKATWTAGRLGFISNISIKNKKLLLLKPETYMNLSGKAVKYWMDSEKIALQNVLVITDDLALPVAKLRLKLKGTDGGHNGLKSINEILQSVEYPRLRFGIGNDFPKGRQVEHVLGKWKGTELPEVIAAIDKAIDAVEMFVLQGAGNAMTKVNAG